MVLSFSKLLDNASRLVWKHKILWALAFFVAEGGWFGITNYLQTDDMVAAVKRGEFASGISLWTVIAPYVVHAAIGLGVLLVALFVISEWARVATLQSLQQLKRAEPVSFWAGLRHGAEKFWSVATLDIMLSLPTLGLVAGFLFCMWTQRTLLSLVFAVPLIGYALFLMAWRHFAYCFLVFEDRSAIRAIRMAMQLARRFWKEVVWLVIGRVLFGIAMTIGTVIVVMLTLIPFALLVFLMVNVTPWLVSFGIALVGLLCSVTVLVLIKGWRTAFVYAVMTEAYWEMKGTGETQVQS